VPYRSEFVQAHLTWAEFPVTRVMRCRRIDVVGTGVRRWRACDRVTVGWSGGIAATATRVDVVSRALRGGLHHRGGVSGWLRGVDGGSASATGEDSDELFRHRCRADGLWPG